MESIALIGFGEAATAFAGDGEAWTKARAFDIVAAKLVGAPNPAASAAAALDGVSAALSLVTADQALNAATSAAAQIAPGAFWFDMNSVAPGTKRAAARVVGASGGRYVDVAVMAPVYPARRSVPLLVSGPHAEPGAAFLRALGFSRVHVIEGAIGTASSIKMIRSVMIKGLEALSAECLLAAERAGVRDEVLQSLDASWREESWERRADYHFDRMLVHGLRRAAEMAEVAKTLDDLGMGSAMTRGIVEYQRDIGQLNEQQPPEGLEAKLRLIGLRHLEQTA